MSIYQKFLQDTPCSNSHTMKHMMESQLPVAASFQTPKFLRHPLAPLSFVTGIVTLPRFESLSLGNE